MKCAYCGQDVDNPCLNTRDLPECGNYNSAPKRPRDELHTSHGIGGDVGEDFDQIYTR